MKRKKILILGKDYFLKEIIGNLLHKRGYYVINKSKKDIITKKEKIDILIFETTNDEKQSKNEIYQIQKEFYKTKIFILNNTNKEIFSVEKSLQMKITDLSIQKILNIFV